MAVVTAAVTFAIYIPALQNGFVNWDDERYVVDNDNLRRPGMQLLAWAFFEFYFANWHPLTLLSHALDYKIWELDPFGHHLTSILFHALNTMLVTLLAYRLLQFSRLNTVVAEVQSPPIPPRPLLTASVLSGLLFGLHPLHVESVAWISERKDVLCCFFYLLSLLSYVRFSRLHAYREGSERRSPCRQWSYGAAIAFFLLALMSKPMAISLPFVLLILDWYPLQRMMPVKYQLVEKWPFFLLGLAAGIATLFAQASWQAIIPFNDVPLAGRLLLACNALVAYLVNMIWPFDLSPFYPFPRDISFFSFSYGAPVLLTISVTAIFFIRAKKDRHWMALWSYYIVTMLPVIGIIRVGMQAMADRYMYIPSIGPLLLAAVALVRWSRIAHARVRWQRTASIAVPLLGTGLVAGLSFLTVGQIAMWKDGVALWSRVIERHPEIAFAHNSLGNAYAKNGRHTEALHGYNTALQLNPEYTEVYYNRGILLASQDRLQEAARDYMVVLSRQAAQEGAETTLKMRRIYALSHNNLGNLHLAAGRIEEAIREYQAALQLKPDLFGTRRNLGNAYMKLGRLDDAAREYGAIVQLMPDNAEAHNNLGVIYQRKGRISDALAEYETAVRINPEYGDAYYNLGCMYEQSGMKTEAARNFREALRLHPSDTEAFRKLEAL